MDPQMTVAIVSGVLSFISGYIIASYSARQRAQEQQREFENKLRLLEAEFEEKRQRDLREYLSGFGRPEQELRNLLEARVPYPYQYQLPEAAAPCREVRFAYGIEGDAIMDEDHGRLFGAVLQLGFEWYKQRVEWFRYNPAPGVYDWGPLDRVADSARVAGINVLFTVVKAPQWARQPGDTEQCPPTDSATYAEFLKQMAIHFKGRVQAYEIWDEQNLYDCRSLGSKFDAAKYVQLLKAAYQAIKSEDPSAIVISGALAPTGYNDGNIAIDERAYLEQMYQSGLKNYCDAIGAHLSGYLSGYNNPPYAKRYPYWFFHGTMEHYRHIMLKYGDGAKRIWVTQFGWASVENLGVVQVQGYKHAFDNTEAEQAELIICTYQMAKSWSWVGPTFLWNLNFGPIYGVQDKRAAFCIVYPDWSPRPAFTALVKMPK